jgi:hypothetical protein
MESVATRGIGPKVNGHISKILAYQNLERSQLPWVWLRKFRSLPTWLLVWVFWSVLRKNHPWRKHKRFTLMEWYNRQTELCRSYDLIWWAMVFAMVLIIHLLVIR